MNEQEKFWQGEFGTEYITRNQTNEFLKANENLFKTIFEFTHDISSILELGANVGMNLQAIRNLIPDVEIDALEINEVAADILKSKSICRNVYNGSIADAHFKHKYDLVFTKTVLIHLNEKDLEKAFQCLYNYSNKYILIAEYFNPVPVTIRYRGHDNKLFKRDFCEDLCKMFPDLKLIKYGFVYRNDPLFPLDDITWFLLEK